MKKEEDHAKGKLRVIDAYEKILKYSFFHWQMMMIKLKLRCYCISKDIFHKCINIKQFVVNTHCYYGDQCMVFE